MITQQKDKALKLTNQFSQTLLTKLNQRGVPTSLASFAFYNINSKKFLHCSSSKIWHYDSHELNPLESYSLGKVICNKFKVDSTNWENEAKISFAKDPQVNERSADVAKFVRIKEGYAGICIKSDSGLEKINPIVLNKTIYETLFILKNNINPKSYSSSLLDIDDVNINYLTKNYQADILNEKKCNNNSYTGLQVDDLKLNSKEIVILTALAEHWTCSQKEISGVSNSDIRNLKTKINKLGFSSFSDLLKMLKQKNIFI